MYIYIHNKLYKLYILCTMYTSGSRLSNTLAVHVFTYNESIYMRPEIPGPLRKRRAPSIYNDNNNNNNSAKGYPCRTKTTPIRWQCGDTVQNRAVVTFHLRPSNLSIGRYYIMYIVRVQIQITSLYAITSILYDHKLL